MSKEKPLIDWSAVLKGFLAGGLIAGFFTLRLHILLVSLVFVYGILVILDALMPKKEEHDYPILSVFGLFIGFLAAFSAKLIKFDQYALIIIAIATIYYLYKILRRKNATRI